MRCKHPECKCGNAEIPESKQFIYRLAGKRVPVPYCQWAIKQMEAENAAYPKAPQSKKYLEGKKKRG